MSAPPFRLRYTREASSILDDLQRPQFEKKRKKVDKARRMLRDQGPAYPGLNSHKFSSLSGPNGEEVWESYVENRTPGAWRIFWIYGPAADEITIISVGPHPDRG
ncbi:hypothetical protein BJY21_000088 [Kineosphaera limosa]|uniref:Type II toxin-antitoxin system RelE/ParE family toxin n=1 Tax=Kineosphaera limosa NBRC 100340 TaxID=1184609 RepID=K6WLU4_9MICO|nr:hypothetical protein [Kineosphaera limosa]NYD98903.1 hypothetical protein [Kineosphaera limosa]GAB94771.1 hypothetical protein KILIM_011_00440 [Kineosphaera limosa NBRC 100340]